MLVLTAAGICLSVVTEGTPLFLLIIFLCIRNFGASFVMMNSNTWGINSLSKDMISNGNAVSTTFRQISMSFGAAISTCVYTYVANSFPGGIEDPACGVIGINASFFCQACMCAFAVVVCLIFVRNTKSPTN